MSTTTTSIPAEPLFPDIKPMGYHEAVTRALDRVGSNQIETAWSDALSTSQGDLAPVTLRTEDGTIIERRQTVTVAVPEAVFRTYSGLGGTRGWLCANWSWQVRGALDRLVGGVGMRRGRRHPNDIRVGDAVDFWRVEAIEEGSLLRLRAEMKVPGRAWLQFESRPYGEGQSLLIQTAFFAPKGLLGLAYWYLLYPVHRMIFAGMIRKIAARAELAPVGVQTGADVAHSQGG